MGEVLTFLRTVPSQKEAQNTISQLAQNGKIKWTKHAKERMEERGVSILQVINCLLKGRITSIDQYKDDVGFKVGLERIVAGEKIRVVVFLESNNTVVKIVTVMNI